QRRLFGRLNPPPGIGGDLGRFGGAGQRAGEKHVWPIADFGEPAGRLLEAPPPLLGEGALLVRDSLGSRWNGDSVSDNGDLHIRPFDQLRLVTSTLSRGPHTISDPRLSGPRGPGRRLRSRDRGVFPPSFSAVAEREKADRRGTQNENSRIDPGPEKEHEYAHH